MTDPTRSRLPSLYHSLLRALPIRRQSYARALTTRHYRSAPSAPRPRFFARAVAATGVRTPSPFFPNPPPGVNPIFAIIRPP